MSIAGLTVKTLPSDHNGGSAMVIGCILKCRLSVAFYVASITVKYLVFFDQFRFWKNGFSPQGATGLLAKYYYPTKTEKRLISF